MRGHVALYVPGKPRGREERGREGERREGGREGGRVGS